MRILITGSSGLLGLNLALDALAAHDVIGVDRSRLANVPFRLINADLLETGAADRVIDEAQPDWLINCAALADLEACEADPGLASRLNGELPGVVADACARAGVRMVHVSTDAVFDGMQEGSYSEKDPPSPLGVYAETKLKGERAVAEANPDAIVARVNFYGYSLSGKRSLSEYFLNNLIDGRRMNGFADVWFCPTLVSDLIDTLLEMLSKNLSGLYHAVGADSMTKYDFGVALARQFGLDESLIRPISIKDSSLTAHRSHNLRLSIHRLTTDLGRPVHGFSAGIKRFYTQYQQGYPQKLRSYQQFNT